MSWKTAAAVFIVVFTIVLLQSVLVAPLITVTETLNDTGDYSDLEGADSDYNGNDFITGLTDDWLNMGLVGMFGIMAWAAARVLRRELTRGGGL